MREFLTRNSHWQEFPTGSAALVVIDERVVHQNMRTLEIEAETHFLQTQQGERLPEAFLILGFAIEQQESPTPGTSNFSAKSAVLEGSFIGGIYAVTRNLRRHAFFRQP